MAAPGYNYIMQHPTTGTAVGVKPGEDPEAAIRRYNQIQFGTETPDLANAMRGVTVTPHTWDPEINVPLAKSQTGVQSYNPSMYSDPNSLLNSMPKTMAPNVTTSSPSYRAQSYTGQLGVNDSGGMSSGGGAIRVRMPDGSERSFDRIDPELDALFKQGGQVFHKGQWQSPTSLYGGYLVGGDPLNVVLGGQLTSEQSAALQTAGQVPFNINAGGTSEQRLQDMINAAVQAGQGGSAGLAHGVAPEYKQLLDMMRESYQQDQARRNTTTDQIYGSQSELLNQIMSRWNQGLSPEAKAALTAQAIDQVPGQFERAESDLMTSLRRAGGRGSGLPAGGEFLRGYAPLEAEKLKTRADLLRKVTLSDEDAKAQNRAQALQAGSQQNALLNSILQGYDPTRLASAALGATTGLLNTTTAMNQTQFQGLELAQRAIQTGSQRDIDLARLELEKDDNSTRKLILTSLLSAAVRPGGIVDKGVNALFDWFLGGEDEVDAQGNPTGSKKTGGIGDGIKAVAAAGAAGAKSVASAVGGAAKALGGLFTNPITAGVAGVALAGIAWTKSQAHHEADTMVEKFENPFHYDYLAPFVQEFQKAFQAGMSKADAEALKASFLESWETYVEKAKEFGRGGSDERKVSEQSIANLQNVAITPILDSINGVIALL